VFYFSFLYLCINNWEALTLNRQLSTDKETRFFSAKSTKTPVNVSNTCKKGIQPLINLQLTYSVFYHPRPTFQNLPLPSCNIQFHTFLLMIRPHIQRSTQKFGISFNSHCFRLNTLLIEKRFHLKTTAYRRRSCMLALKSTILPTQALWYNRIRWHIMLANEVPFL
jgi:hypothetical protein